MANAILRIITTFLVGIFIFAIGIVSIVAVVLPFFWGRIGEALAEQSIALAPWQAIGLIELLLGGGILLLGLICYFFILLRRLLRTVEAGDPFVAENSTRLTRMAWVAVAGNVWSVLYSIYAARIAQIFESALEAEGAHLTVSVDFGGIGLVLILVLFVLASVFRKGTEMRADLEGTV